MSLFHESSFKFDEVLARSLSNYRQKSLVFLVYPECPSLCPIVTLLKYLQFQSSRSSDQGLFIITLLPYRKVSSDTIARWLKQTMADTDIDTGKLQHIHVPDLPPPQKVKTLE